MTLPANRLIDSTSPYLLQHAHNPVEWHPWDSHALQLAAREGKPIFLSIGYAACHWCHVMERECFERPEIAALMNRHFVNIKVDREERPDLDELYMLATQIMSGSGGWPMSVWLTPELMPFYAGTYFPPVDGHGRPGFPRLLTALANTWQNRRGELLEQAQKVVEAVKLHVDESDENTKREKSGTKLPVRDWVRLAVEQMADRFDAVNGGFGGAPKFPPHQALGFLIALLATPDAAFSSGDRGIVGGQLAKTLDAMARGGIYDHVGGGFARYSTDERWLVPHFEKMLYDSAQLAPVYAEASVLLGNADYARIARETLDFFLREMRSPEGAFFSSLDADSEGEEGKYYVWTLADVQAALSEKEAEQVVAYFGVTAEGNWHETPVAGGNVLAVAQGQAFNVEIGRLLEKMRVFRQHRVRPGLDDKILTSWNGLMLSALAVCGRVLGEPRYVDAAVRLADFLLTRHAGKDGRLLRTSRQGPAHTEGFLDDYAFLLQGLVDLAETQQGEARSKTLARAAALADVMIEDFEDAARGGFYFTGPRHEQLFARMKNAADNATPSANGVAIRALFRLARQTAVPRYGEIAGHAVRAFEANIARRPEYFSTIMRGLVEEGVESRQPAAVARKADDESASSAFTLTVDKVEREGGINAFAVTFRVGIAEGFHIQLADAAAPLVKTVARLRSLGAAEIVSQEWNYPPAQPTDGTSGFSGTVETQCHCALRGPPGMHMLRASVTAQACTASECLSPETVAVEFSVEIV